MHDHVLLGAAAVLQRLGGAAVQGVPLGAGNAVGDRGPHERVDEVRVLDEADRGQDVERRSVAGDRLEQLRIGAIPEHRQRARRAACACVEAEQPQLDRAGDARRHRGA